MSLVTDIRTWRRYSENAPVQPVHCAACQTKFRGQRFQKFRHEQTDTQTDAMPGGRRGRVMKINKFAQSNFWEEGRVAALSHTYAVKSSLVTMARPNSPQKHPFPWTDSQTPLPASYSWTRPTYDAKRHPDPIRRFPECTGQTYAQTHVRTDRRTVWRL